jgi:MFS family permease
VRALVAHPTYQWVLVGVLLYGAGYGVFITLIPAFLISAKSGNLIRVGVFFTLFYIALGMSQLIAGPVSDRYGRKPVMVVVWGKVTAGRQPST